MLQESLDLREEAGELHAFLLTLEEADFARPTTFKNWTPWDVVAHLHFFDEFSLAALAGEDAFRARQKEFMEVAGSGKRNTEIARERYGPLPPGELLQRWLSANRELAEQLGARDPKQRLPWFGPDMGVRMFTTARYMETWAHGQAVYDLVGQEREHSDRIRNIAVIGARTFAWTFQNRGIEPPGPPPYLRLRAPSGADWEWNAPSETEYIQGDALDFCQVVTQVRNIADTRLEVVGPVATRWMSIAQCFAGGPEDPPAPGARTGAAA